MPYGNKSPKQKRSCYKMQAADYNNSPMMKNFPDLNKDGKVTKADVLMGRGVELDSPKKKYKKCPGCKSTCPSCRK